MKRDNNDSFEIDTNPLPTNTAYGQKKINLEDESEFNFDTTPLPTQIDSDEETGLNTQNNMPKNNYTQNQMNQHQKPSLNIQGQSQQHYKPTPQPYQPHSHSQGYGLNHQKFQ